MLSQIDMERLDWILSKAQSSSSLSEWEIGFINDLTDRRDRYKNHISISEKQEEILERISEKD